jgi:hypothetical protein
MKKQLLLVFVFFTSLVFSQSASQKIQNYINNNQNRLNISSNELSNWVIESETSSETTGITNYLVLQTYNGIKIDNNFMYFWIKNGQVINEPEGFVNEVSKKINVTQFNLNVLDGFSSALLKVNEPVFSSSVIRSENNKFKLSNGVLTDDLVSAELVYFLNENGNLILSWNYEFYSQNTQHLWEVRIDASNGNLIEKRDLVTKCSFGPNHNHSNCETLKKEYSFEKAAFLNNNQAVNFLTPGTTNYRVIPWNYESPNHSPRQLITNPEATTVLAPSVNAASPNGWHNTNNTIGGGTAITQFAISRGNNVFAKDDFDANNTGGASPSGGVYPSLTFDFPYGGTGVAASTYANAAITNLFYQNNIMHDLWYQYGFTEANRNFQFSNYGRGGLGSDAVNADAQDGSTLATPNLNNANFATPGDGSAPRMQMYLWNVRKPSSLLINSGSLSGTNFNILDNGFNPGHVNLPNSPAALTNDLVLYQDATPDVTDACEAPLNAAALSGKIAVIRRGTCAFVIKVKNAQVAGAIGVIIVNDEPGTIPMGGADATITIPAVSMSQVDGEALIAAMASGTVNVSLSNPEVYVNGDGDFDNGIIAHEYGHGVSTRLVGGGAGLNSSEQPGEGWSDWLWLMMQIKPGDTKEDAKGIATFASNQPTNGVGIRQYRYSTNMAVNPHTFASTNSMWFTDAGGSDVVDRHSVGSVWCVILWDLAWNYIEKYGYDANIYNGTGGNNKVMRLVIDAMKLTPANPSLIQCRNAIIQADINSTNGQNYCMIWSTFARRGMGINATSGSNVGVAGIQDQTQDFTEPIPGVTPATGSNCTLLGNDYFQNSDLFRIYPNPTNGLLNINVNNYIGDLKINVYDLNGRQVYNQNVTSFNNTNAIDLGSLSSGVYVLKLQGESLNYSKRIILE